MLENINQGNSSLRASKLHLWQDMTFVLRFLLLLLLYCIYGVLFLLVCFCKSPLERWDFSLSPALTLPASSPNVFLRAGVSPKTEPGSTWGGGRTFNCVRGNPSVHGSFAFAHHHRIIIQQKKRHQVAHL